MKVRWRRPFAAALLLMFASQAAFAGPGEGPRSLRKLEPGRAVHVTMKSHEGFNAIWIGRDGDRAIFGRLDPDETIGVRLDALLEVKLLPHKREMSRENAAWGTLGFFAGLFGAMLVMGLALRGT
jgi:hypothetical protein